MKLKCRFCQKIESSLILDPAIASAEISQNLHKHMAAKHPDKVVEWQANFTTLLNVIGWMFFVSNYGEFVLDPDKKPEEDRLVKVYQTNAAAVLQALHIGVATSPPQPIIPA